MKRNRMLLAGLFTFALVCVSLTFVGSTYAKYTSEVTGSDTVKSAVYAWTVNTAQESTGAFTFEFGVDGTQQELIAPGDKLTATITIKNNSEVDLLFDFEESKTFTMNSGSADDPTQISYKVGDGTAEDAITDDLLLVKGDTVVITITLTWPEGTTDAHHENDTTIGRNGATWTVEVTATATQKIGTTKPVTTE